jgi:DNA-binding NarL/FixJ family response regulator
MPTPIRVLIAEDSEAMRTAICALLANEPGIGVCGQANNYDELFKVHLECSPEVVLMDLRMPGNERVNTEYVKGQLRSSCLLAMSFAKDEETVNLAKAYGAIKLLDKVDLASILAPAIRECVSQGGKVHHA